MKRYFFKNWMVLKTDPGHYLNETVFIEEILITKKEAIKIFKELKSKNEDEFYMLAKIKRTKNNRK